MRADRMAPAMWILTVALVVAVAFLAGFVAGRRMPSRQNVGEAMVAATIRGGLRRPHLLLNNITFQIGERTSQIDHIVVTATGIFVVETKHYSGWIFGNPHEGRWTQTFHRSKFQFQNPVRQNYGHVKALQGLFNLPVEAFFSVVVFTGSAEFKTDLGPGVVKLGSLLWHLNLVRPVLFDERQMTYIAGRIEMKRMRRSIETDEYHLNYIWRRVKPARFNE
jgi:hypothetical protein